MAGFCRMDTPNGFWCVAGSVRDAKGRRTFLVMEKGATALDDKPLVLIPASTKRAAMATAHKLNAEVMAAARQRAEANRNRP